MSCVKQIKLIDNTRLAGCPVHGLAGGTQLKVRPWRWAEQCSVVPVSRHIGALLSTRTPVATSTATVIIRGRGKWHTLGEMGIQIRLWNIHSSCLPSNKYLHQVPPLLKCPLSFITQRIFVKMMLCIFIFRVVVTTVAVTQLAVSTIGI